MKKVIFVGVLTLGLMSFAQNGKGRGNQKEKDSGQSEMTREKGDSQKEHPGKGKEKHKVNKSTDLKPNHSVHPGKGSGPKNNKEKKAHPAHSNGHAYGKNKGGLTGREFGQQRASHAKSKHKKPESEAEAVSIITVIHEQNMTLLGRIKDKIEEVRDRLRERVRIGDLSKEVFEARQIRVSELEKRREEIASELLKL